MKPTLIIFVKEPRAGRVKTRLGAGLGMAAAAQWFRNQSGALIRRLSRDPRWRLVLAVTPDNTITSRVWPESIPRLPQGQGDLGTRMVRALKEFGPGPVIIIGADIPGIRAHHIAEAIRKLRAYDAVFGPAPDGGYWLVGLKSARVPAGFMENVRWSTVHALKDTCASLPQNARVALLEVLRDVDTVGDL